MSGGQHGAVNRDDEQLDLPGGFIHHLLRQRGAVTRDLIRGLAERDQPVKAGARKELPNGRRKIAPADDRDAQLRQALGGEPLIDADVDESLDPVRDRLRFGRAGQQEPRPNEFIE